MNNKMVSILVIYHGLTRLDFRIKIVIDDQVIS